MKASSKPPCVCGKPTIPGLISGVSLCQYHYNVKMFGQVWADHVQQEKPA